ncbi:MAG: hypothetical protein ABFS43_07685 [Thermodesulfobacteriota bacterium]
MYYSNIAVIAWLVIFLAAMAAAIIKSEMKSLLMIMVDAGIMASKLLVNEYASFSCPSACWPRPLFCF